MKHRQKIALRVALTVTAAGVLLSVGTLSAARFDISRVIPQPTSPANQTAQTPPAGQTSLPPSSSPVTDGDGYTVVTQQIKEAFDHISVDGDTCNVRLIPSQDGVCQVEYPTHPEMTCSISVRGDTLEIVFEDHRTWQNLVGMSVQPLELNLYLPQSQYDQLELSTVSGSMTVPENFSFTQSTLHTTSGEVQFTAANSGSLSLESVSGELSVKGVTPQTLKVHTTSGDIHLSQVVVSDTCTMDSVSGDVEVQDCDGAAWTISTTSGDVEASLRSGKTFSTKTVSGEVNVPSDTSGGSCKITTVSGDITCSIL